MYTPRHLPSSEDGRYTQREVIYNSANTEMAKKFLPIRTCVTADNVEYLSGLASQILHFQNNRNSPLFFSSVRKLGSLKKVGKGESFLLLNNHGRLNNFY